MLIHVRLEVLKAVSMSMSVFWDVTPRVLADTNV
jgi:hypothetical protein